MKTSKYKIYLFYSAIFLIAAPLAFYVFLRDEKSFVWKTDALPLYVNVLKYLGTTIRQSVRYLFTTGRIGIPLYDFHIGFGMDRFTFLRYEPLNFLSIFVKAGYTEYLYNLLIIVRIYLAGFAFLIYCNYQKWDTYASLCGSFVYCFSGYTLWAGVRHPEFLMPMIMLPLVCRNVDKIIHGEKAKYFSALIFVSFLCSWYLTYIYTVVLGVWFLVTYFFTKKEERKQTFWRAVLVIIRNYFCGFCYSAFLLFPQIIVYFKSNRTGSRVEWKNLLFYGRGWGEKLIPYLFSQAADPGNWVKINALVIAFFCIPILFLKTKETKWKMQWIVFTLCLFIPAFGFITSGFSVINNRWSFAYSFILACIVAVALPKIKELTFQDKIILMFLLLFYIGLICKSGGYHKKWLSYEIILLLLTYSGMLLINYQSGRMGLYKVGCMTLLLFNIALNGYIRYDKEYANYASEFVDRGEVMNSILDSDLKIVKALQDDDFYRIEYGENGYQSGNWGMYFYRNPTSITYSQLDQYMETFFFDHEIAKYTTKAAFGGLDGRNALLQLFATKYYIQKENKFIIPANYEKILSREGESIYKDQKVLSLGYTYDTYMKEEQYYSLNSIDRQYAMLDSVLIDTTNSELKQSKMDFNRTDLLEISDMAYKELNWDIEEEKVTVKKQNGSIHIKAPAVSKTAEYYIRLVGMNVDSVTSSTLSLSFQLQQQKKNIILRSSANTYWTGMDNILVYLGTFQEEFDCEIVFPKKGTYGLKEIEIYARPIHDLEEFVRQRKEEELEKIEVGINQIEGEITVSERKFLCFSIPYNTGWSCYVDGNKVELQRANTMFMGIILEEGTHTIQLKYVTPGLKAGICVTVLSFLILGIKGFFWRQESFRENK